MALWHLLTTTDGASAIERIVQTPALHAEVRRAAAVLREKAGGAGRDGVVRALFPLVSVYGLSDRSEVEWAKFWRAYQDALGDLPYSALQAGAAAYNRSPDSEFFPKPGPLRDLAIQHNTLGIAAARAHRAASTEAPGREFTEDERRRNREAVSRMLDDYRARFADHKAAVEAEKPKHQCAQAPTDERGLTARMRQHMARPTDPHEYADELRKAAGDAA